jgi:uncharacterized protein
VGGRFPPTALLASRMRVILLVVALLSLCGPVAAGSRPVESLLEIRQRNVVIQHWDNSCGAAALATILTYDLGRPVSEAEVARGMLRRNEPLRVRHRGGFSLLDMKRYAEELGYVADGYSALNLESLAQRTPAIVPIKARGYHHFVVVRAIDRRRVWIADPGFGNYSLSRSAFLDNWPDGIGFFVTSRK